MKTQNTITLTYEQKVSIDLALQARISLFESEHAVVFGDEYRKKCLKNAAAALELVRAA